VGHDHGPASSAAGAQRGRMLVVLALSAVVLVVEVIGAWVTGSLALLADAGHMLTDVAGIGLAIAAVTFAARPATPRRTFGYYRLEILAAVVNALLLFAIAGYLLWEAWQRWQAPPEVAAGLMVAFAAVGLVANLVGIFVLRTGSRTSLNVKGAYLEVLSDMLGSIAVIVAAVVIAVTGWERADIVASVAVALMILPRSARLLMEAVDVLLEAAPRGIDLDQVRQHILQEPGVIDAHDLHAWTITSGMPVLSVHVVVSDELVRREGTGPILDRLGGCLAEHFDVEHSTIQVESPGHHAHEVGIHP